MTALDTKNLQNLANLSFEDFVTGQKVNGIDFSDWQDRYGFAANDNYRDNGVWSDSPAAGRRVA